MLIRFTHSTKPIGIKEKRNGIASTRNVALVCLIKGVNRIGMEETMAKRTLRSLQQQTMEPTKQKLGVYEVTLEHGDRALPDGFVTAGDGAFVTYLFAPGHSRDHGRGRAVGSSKSLQEAIEDVRKAWENSI